MRTSREADPTRIESLPIELILLIQADPPSAVQRANWLIALLVSIHFTVTLLVARVSAAPAATSPAAPDWKTKAIGKSGWSLTGQAKASLMKKCEADKSGK